MDLILWRHTEAEDGSPDISRALTPCGQQQATAMAEWLSARLPQAPNILCSPAERCQQTALALSPTFTTLPEISPGASFRTLLRATGWPKESGLIVLVNHQPTLGELVAYLLCGEPRAWKVRRGAIWWLSLQRRSTHTHVTLKACVSPDLV
ncbi:MAG: histidine phosphatase family protein [Betaproteobacteria bacterium]|nr:histidine phosphatase family protein [Betaproteobacteria bacterium]